MTSKLVLFAATATLAFGGAALAQTANSQFVIHDGINPAPNYPATAGRHAASTATVIHDGINPAPNYPATAGRKVASTSTVIRDGINPAPNYKPTATAYGSARR